MVVATSLPVRRVHDRDGCPDGMAPAGANPRYYRMLAVALAIGIVVAIVLGLTDVTGPGLLELEASIVTLFLATIVIAVVLTFFLVRVGDIFSIEAKLRTLLDAEGSKWSQALTEEQRKADELREALRRDAAKTNQDVLKETASQRMRIDDANSAAVRAANEAQSALAQVAELRRRPETSQEVQALKAQLERDEKEMAELKRRDNVNSPLLKELQEAVKGLEAEMKKQRVKLAEALDVAEKREMEAAATRAGLEQEVTDLRKRAEILALKSRDLEGKNAELADAARKPRITFKDGEESQHVLLLEGIGNKYAARLNAVGIISIPQLVEARASDVAAQLQVEQGLVEEWQGMGRLLPLSGIGPQAAEILARAGIRSIPQLASQDALDLSLKCKELVAGKKVKFTSIDVTPALAKKWIETAREGKLDATA
jgi:predicted flap endonuclease-1-like 5' DNA nuclease/low affinity Fe/Cu permease